MGQSLALVQPTHIPAEEHAGVALPDTHAVHIPPSCPHSALDVPGWQSDPSQQPPLHAVSPELPQLAEQVLVLVLHVFCGSQSSWVSQPHDPPLRHAVPFPEQTEQNPPTGPHAEGSVPA